MTATEPAEPAERPELPLEVEELLSWMASERGRSANTLAAYRRDLTRYVTWLAGRGSTPLTATEDDVVAHVGALRADGLAPASVKRALVAVRSLHRYLADEGRTPTDPAAAVEPPRVPAGLPHALVARRR